MATRINYQNNVQPYLDTIKSMRIDGYKEEDIARHLGISNSTWYKYKAKYNDMAEALKESKLTLISKLEQTLYQKALEGQPTLLIFALKNLAPKKWGEKQEVDEMLGKFFDAMEDFEKRVSNGVQ